MYERKPYVRPVVTHYNSAAECPDRIRKVVDSLYRDQASTSPSQWKVKPDYTTLVDSDRRYVEVSDSFCKLVGYKREDLIGRRYDDLSAPNTNDIAVVSDLFSRLRYMHGMWMLVSRSGARILVRYESWLRPDSLIQGNMEVVAAGY
jgi:PAS domain S-box-containing protein